MFVSSFAEIVRLVFVDGMNEPSEELTITMLLSVSSFLLWFCRVTAALSATSLKDPRVQH